MRTSGRGGSEALLFIAPAVILAWLFLWLSGNTTGVLLTLDAWLVRSSNAVLAAAASLIS
jgi:hypothetical protein